LADAGIFDHDEKSAARILGVAPRTLRRWRIEGKIGHYRLPGGRVRYTVQQLIDLQRASKIEPIGRT